MATAAEESSDARRRSGPDAPDAFEEESPGDGPSSFRSARSETSGGDGADPAPTPTEVTSGDADADAESESESADREVADTGLRSRLVRQSHAASNLQDAAGERAQAVHVRMDDETEAMGSMDRRKIFLERILCCGRRAGPSKPEEAEAKSKLQYRLQAKSIVASRWRRCRRALHNIVCFGAGYSMLDAQSYGAGGGLNRALAFYLDWLFRTSFVVFVVYSAAMYYVSVLFFTGLIAAAGKLDGGCVLVGGMPYAHARTGFSDAFALSWTTFSTVGYGNSNPALSGQHPDHDLCELITAVCVVESFIGVLFSAFIGSILFGKILRIQSQAQVLFSHPIVVQFGLDALGEDEEEGDDENDKESAASGNGHLGTVHTKKAGKLPCPVLEFRVANRLHNEVGGEIMDATINVVASLDPDEVDPVIRDTLVRRGGLRDTLMPRRTVQPETQSDQDLESGMPVRLPPKRSSLMVSRLTTSRKSVLESTLSQTLLGKTIDHKAVEEDPTNNIARPRIFSKLLIDASEHPFFKRVWLVRHTLNDTSPLLTPKARKLIRKNGGHWPERLNNAAGVRKSLHFNQILVSLGGISNVSGSDVFALKIYNLIDMVVGYQFVNVLYHSDDGNLRVDLNLLNDVTEQNGGGGESLGM